MTLRQTVFLIVLGLGLIIGWHFLVNWIWPTKPKTPKPNQEAVMLVMGGMATGVEDVAKLKRVGKIEDEVVPEPEPKKDPEPKKAPELKPEQSSELIALGRGQKPFYLQVLLNTRGGSVQQVIATEFPEANREGLEVREIIIGVKSRLDANGLLVVEEVDPESPGAKAGIRPGDILTRAGDTPVKSAHALREWLQHRQPGETIKIGLVREGTAADVEVKVLAKPQPLHLVPGIIRKRVESIREQRKVKDPELLPGPVDIETLLSMSDPSYVMFHYEKPGDERPLNTLGNINWKKLEVGNEPDADEHRVVFQAELGEPHNLVITKTFTLKRREYHIGMQVDIARKEGMKGPGHFRYQIQGAHGLPMEGEWYTSTFRQAIVGFADDKGSNVSRYIEDAREIRRTEGGDRQTRTDKQAIHYLAVAVQYFASAIAVDDQQEKRNFVEFARATPVGKTHKDREFLDDVTIRAISESFSTDQDVTHKYLLYNGPVKVRLLRQLPSDKAVDSGLVDRYHDKLHLDTLTDAPMPNALGRFANAIFWTDLVIAFTNLIHSLLWLLNQFVPNLGICIIIITIIVRGMLFPLSRRQAHNAQVMQAKMAKLAPELKKIQEKYGGDFQRMNQERLKLYREHGVNPFAAMGGCLLLLLQMPVFMGLYFALQESVFFRLEGFLWIQNLAAPDMLIFWSEAIPFISKPEDIGSTIYLGPYFNVLPVIAVVLMLYQQKKMMPPTDDPQMQAQQRMMKFMMILFGLFFYKVPAGLCLYFIASTLWGLAERKLLPKPVKPEEVDETAAGAAKSEEKPEPPRPLGWWGRRKQRWKERWKEILEHAQKQSDHRRAEQQKGQPPAPDEGGGNAKKKKKKKKR